jgi:hypothetical protein
VPEEKMSQHAGQHMMSPPGKLPRLVMIHPQIRLCFLKALLDGPASVTLRRRDNPVLTITRIAGGLRKAAGLCGKCEPGPGYPVNTSKTAATYFLTSQNNPPILSTRKGTSNQFNSVNRLLSRRQGP